MTEEIKVKTTETTKSFHLSFSSALCLFLMLLALGSSAEWELGFRLGAGTIPNFYSASNDISRYLNYTRTIDSRTYSADQFVAFSSNAYDPNELTNENVRLPAYAHTPLISEAAFRLTRALTPKWSLFADAGVMFGFSRQTSYTKYYGLTPGTSNLYNAVLTYSSADRLNMWMPRFGLGVRYMDPAFHFFNIVPYVSYSTSVILMSSVVASTHILSHLDENLVNGVPVSFSNQASTAFLTRTLSEEADITTTLNGFYLEHQLEIGARFQTGSNAVAQIGAGVSLDQVYISSSSRNESYSSAEFVTTPIYSDGVFVNFLTYDRTSKSTSLGARSTLMLGLKLSVTISTTF